MKSCPKNHKKNIFLVCMFFNMLFTMACGILSNTVCAQAQDFIIKPVKTKKLSVDALKENIGQATKTLFQTTTSMNKNLGSLHIDIAQAQTVFMHTNNHKFAPTVLEQTTKITKTFGVLQIELASLQSKFSDIIEKLIENQAPFNKASRADLEGALSIIQTVDKELGNNISVCKNMRSCITSTSNTTGTAGKTGLVSLDDHETLVVNSLKDIEKKLEQHITAVKNAHLTMAKNVCLK